MLLISYQTKYAVNCQSLQLGDDEGFDIGFDGAETNCGIAFILGIILMNGYSNQMSSGALVITFMVCPLRFKR